MPIVYDKNGGIHYQVCQTLRIDWVRRKHKVAMRCVIAKAIVDIEKSDFSGAG